jgi:hypothetical protein
MAGSSTQWEWSNIEKGGNGGTKVVWNQMMSFYSWDTIVTVRGRNATVQDVGSFIYSIEIIG